LQKPVKIVAVLLAANAMVMPITPAAAQTATGQARSSAQGKQALRPAAETNAAASAENKGGNDAFAGLMAIVNRNANDAAKLDHVRLLSTDEELDQRADFDAVNKYIVTTCGVISTFFNNAKHGKPIGLSVNCNLLPKGHALYELEVRPLERQDNKMAVRLTEALEQVKVPVVTGPINLQILMKVWYPKTEAGPYFKKGFELQKAGKDQEAVAQYSQAVVIDPSHTEAFTCRGLAYNALGQYDKAIADFTRAISLGSHDAYITRAYAYRKLKDSDNALADCNRAIELDPKYWEGYVSRAEILQDNGNYTDAIKDCNTVLGFMTTCGYAYLVRGECNISLNKPDDAVKDLTMAIEILAKSGEAYHYRAVAYKAVGRELDAAADDSRATELGYKTQ
jgi:tetratricopeptide (TPR) repeat protein